MALLHNRVSQKELKERLMAETEPRTTISFYKYHPIENPPAFRDELYKQLSPLGVFGRIYVAHEGINAQVSVPAVNFQAFRETLYAIEFLNNTRLNVAVDDDGKSFWVLKIKVRDKIVADGITDPSFNMENKGKYVNAAEINGLMTDPATIVVDMRNHYEYEVGHFENAIEIPSDTFREQLPMAVNMLKDQKDKNIIMYCTGGIRCEKASAYMLHNGFSNVYHLEGGIINYASQVKEQQLETKFIGKNFVFDDRLGERITEHVIAKCHQCGQPADTHTNCRNDACHLLFIQCKACRDKFDGCCTAECQTVYHLPAEEQKGLREGQANGIMIFNKSKKRLRPRLNQPDN
ncbi:rhodanese-related sulfurtransferase [Segetibacter sp. 3557_3]|uniref:oxygen-dependent tRNA uridine(34) hydroxylase TrhO n=1 Tax=Segetibacter sp. 3557_3 TaxID=2547429 RepID=UPI001058541B|nr:rhodanese-related sulfurtransferase [Segetibacter sp. 3557_3]TDH28794.1 rhodanese-related sulfurtransferase [Segetibacter sp. 3557_3]